MTSVYAKKEPRRLDGVAGSMTRRGHVTIEFSGKEWALLSPEGQYLPCEGCGVVFDVDRLVDRFTCAECRQEQD